MSVGESLIKSIMAHQKNSKRSKQEAVGPSEVGGCRRKVWYRLHNQPKTNNNILRLASFMGTAIHQAIEDNLRELDVYNDTFELEIEVGNEELMGHVDLYIPDRGEIVDWKTSKIKSLKYFPSKQQRWQVMLYGYLLKQAGRTVNHVTLVGIPRDGSELDIKIHTEPYDEDTALEALDWLREVKSLTEIPDAEKDISFCKHYCGYFDPTGKTGCTSKLRG